MTHIKRTFENFLDKTVKVNKNTLQENLSNLIENDYVSRIDITKSKYFWQVNELFKNIGRGTENVFVEEKTDDYNLLYIVFNLEDFNNLILFDLSTIDIIKKLINNLEASKYEDIFLTKLTNENLILRIPYNVDII